MPARRNERLIVILNDNDMSIAPPVGALSTYLARLTSSGTYLHLRDIGQAARQAPAEVLGATRRARRGIHAQLLDRRHAVRGARLLLRRPDRRPQSRPSCCRCCKNVRDAKQGPILVHVVTKKGKGYAPAEASDDKYHGVNKFNVVTGAQVKPPSPTRRPTPRCSPRA